MSYTIPIDVLKQNSTKAAYERGMRVYRQGLVENVEAELQKDTIVISADILSSKQVEYYRTELVYSFKTKKLVETYCDCPAFFEYGGLCKHCLALALKYNRLVNERVFSFLPSSNGQQQTSQALQLAMRQKAKKAAIRYQNEAKQILSEPVQLIPILERSKQNGQWSVQFKIGTSAHYYVLKNLSQFVSDLEREEAVSYGKKLSFVHTREAFASHTQPLLDLIAEHILMERNFRQKLYGYYYGSSQTKRDLLLTTANLFRLLRAMPNGEILVNSQATYVITETSAPVLPIILEAKKGGYQLTLPPLQLLQDGKQYCLVQNGSFTFCGVEFAEAVQVLVDLSSVDRQQSHFVSEADLNAFCATILPALIKCSNVKLDGLEAYRPEPCQLRVYLDDDGFQILCRAEAWYGQQKFFLNEQEPKENLRDFEAEYGLRSVLEQYFPAWNSYGELYFSNEDDACLYRLLTEGLAHIGQMAELYLSDRMKRIQVQPQPKLQIGVRINGGLLDMDIDAERLPKQELQGLLNSYRQRRKYYRMKNGDFLQLEEGSLTTLAELADGLEVPERNLEQGHLQAPVYQAYYVDQVLREGGERLTVQRDLNFRSMIRTLKYYEDSDDEVPAGLTTTLRQYQQTGYQWLMTLTRMGLGGILADDMGLGKTVQVITMLLAHQEKLLQKPALIITPASLVYNWESEIHRFAPTLTVCSITGTAAERHQLLQQTTAQIWLTSYDLLKRDVDYYTQSFSFCIIDEAQNIKNHSTKAAKAVKAIQSDNRFALTGTPIENRLSELWSIFDFLLPGILGRYEVFRQCYEIAIVQGQDEVALKRLQKMIQPFLLRRLKQDVLKDLPEKIETIVYSKMETAQRELYIANLQRVLDGLQKKSDAEVQSEKLQILAELTRLRQLCCDPSLLYENYNGGSAKLDTCMELIDNALQSGRKVLVFSQFTTMLDRIRQRLETQHIASFTLIGATSKEKRAELVQRFNKNDEAPVFLISLKAGGTGLNLTAASVVIHVDPWWNAAAQEQATDRAHRIGQKQAVSVFQLITKDTIEEKIQALQAQKLALSHSVIAAQGMSIASLNKDEILEILQS